LARSRIYYVNKETFLPAFKEAYKKTFTLENVRAGFRGARLVPYNPEAVLLKRKTRKRRYVRAEETLIVNEVSDLIAKIDGSRRKDSETPAKRVRAERRCGRCSEVGHNSRTCRVEIVDVDNSDASK
jgi:hypothetical protein